jgi:hypothetical protein
MSDKPSTSLAGEIMQARKPRINVALPPREDLPDDAVTTRAREIGEKWGANTQLRPADAPAPEVSAKRQTEMVSVRFDFPAYVDEQLAVKAASTRGPSGGKITKTYLALKALKDAGYRVEDEDLIEDRRRNRK